jgi:endonuclease/exonuclease/phosphatase family metal-dependent hydrolase
MQGIGTLVIVAVFSITSVAGHEVCILTYNMMGMMPGSDPEARIQYIIENLERLNPDIIGLQEINETLDGTYNQAEIIVDSLSAHFEEEYYLYTEFTHLSWDNQYRESIGIISRFPILEQGFGQLVVGVFPRKVVWAAIDSPIGRLNFFNTHLSFNDPHVRELQVQQIIGFITYTEGFSPGIGSVLVGDFNDSPDSDAIELLTDPGTEVFYIDTYALSNPGSPGYTAPSYSPEIRIDYIFEKSTSSLAVDTSLVVIDEPYEGTNYCSDHLGVLTLFYRDLTGSIDHIREPVFSLLSPRPNPSRATVSIPYVLPRDALVSLTVYTMAGHCVRTLVSEERPQGLHERIWDSRDAHGLLVPSATYMVRLEIQGITRDSQLTIVR